MAMIEHPTLDMERQLAAQGCDVVIGCDEVGRGALAGPVMVGAAAMWSRDLAAAQVPAGVADSKLLTESTGAKESSTSCVRGAPLTR